MENKKDGSGFLHRCRTSLLQKSKAFVSDRRMKHSHQYINLQPGERSSGFLHSLFHFDTHDRGKLFGSVTCLSAFPVSGYYLYAFLITNQDFVAHKKYPAYLLPGGAREGSM